jgi:hypothetical protein
VEADVVVEFIRLRSRAVLAANSSAETPKKIRWEARAEITRGGFSRTLSVRHRDTCDPAHGVP